MILTFFSLRKERIAKTLIIIRQLFYVENELEIGFDRVLDSLEKEEARFVRVHF